MLSGEIDREKEQSGQTQQTKGLIFFFFFVRCVQRLFPAESPADTPGGAETSGVLIEPKSLTPAPSADPALAVADDDPLSLPHTAYFRASSVAELIKKHLTTVQPAAAAAAADGKQQAAEVKGAGAGAAQDTSGGAPLPAPMELKVLPRSEGVLAFNAKSTGPFNERASLIAGGGVAVHGNALLFQDTGKVNHLLAYALHKHTALCFRLRCAVLCRLHSVSSHR